MYKEALTTDEPWNLSPLNGNRINKHSFAVTINSSAVTAADKLQYKIVPVFWLTLQYKDKKKLIQRTKKCRVGGARNYPLDTGPMLWPAEPWSR